MKTSTLFLALILIGAASVGAWAEITVISVKGEVSYKTGPEWRKPLAPGMKLQEGVKINTGVRSEAVLKINDNLMTIKPLTMIKVYENVLTKDVSRTRIGLRRGSVQAKINRKENMNTSFQVATPVATSSVRGTEELISYGPGKGMVVRVIEGHVGNENWNGVQREIAGRLVFRQRPDRGDPESIYAGLRDEATSSQREQGVSATEQNSFDFFDAGLDQTGPGMTARNGRPNGKEASGSSSSSVFIILVWP